MQTSYITSTKFSQLNLDAQLLLALQENKLTHCTAIQAQCIPIALTGKDIAGQAQTGTGKTLAFLLVIMQHLLHKPKQSNDSVNHPRAIVVAPTRELAIQIHKDAIALNNQTKLSLGLVYGGVDYQKQLASVQKKLDILIGTPGRLIDYHRKNIFSLKHIEIMVLDEADRMFDLGFIDDIRYMIRHMPAPKDRLNMLFSATLSHRVKELAYEHMNDPQQIITNSDTVTANNITEVIYHISKQEKIQLLLGLMRKIAPKRSIVFSNTKRVVALVSAYLKSNGYKAAMLSGDVPQKKRERFLHEFSTGKISVLVATDLAARGLHIPQVSHVFNYDLPQHAENYVHRIGRTARAGYTGDAVSLACEEFVYSLMEIEEYIGYKLTVLQVDNSLLIEPKPPEKQGKIQKWKKR